MAKRFTKPTINWIEIEKKVPAEQKTSFFAFKGKADGYMRRVYENPAEAPKIDWEQYKKLVPIPGLVDKFKSAYDALKVPYPEDTLSAKVDEQWKTIEPQIKEFCAELQKDIDISTKEIARINALPKFEEMTVEMGFDLYPHLALDSVKKPTFWPHSPDEQEGYKPPEPSAAAKGH